MNGHRSNYQRFLNGDFSKSDTSALYSHLKSDNVEIFKFQIFEVPTTEGIKHSNDSRRLEASLDIKEFHWVCKLETQFPEKVNVRILLSQKRSSIKKIY